MKKFFIMFLVFFSSIVNVSALNINSEHAVMYNLNENTIVYEKNKDGITSIASLTKIMTTLVAIEQISDINENIVLNNIMFEGLYEADAAVIGLTGGQVLTYEDLLYGTFISSGADATRALTISIAGTEANFVKMMNEKAKELGLTNTKFTNATGLDQGVQTSTVDEVAKLLKVALENELFKTIFESKSYSLSDGSMTIYSTLQNTAIRYGLNIKNIIGAKTGYTDDAGFCLASIAYDEVNDIRYLLVTTKAPITFDYAYHLEDAINVYDYYFDNYKYYNLVDEGEELININTQYSNLKNISFKSNKDIKYYFDNTFDKEKVSLEYNGLDTLNPFMKKGKVVGTVDVMYNGEWIDTVSIIITEKISFSIVQFIKSNIIVIALVLFLVTIVTEKSHKHRA
ncbi:MAG: hypothetical protein PHW32_02340 [Bacilli bacterium]|nr:hypothetical protein [Bacilli bacterium]MDD4282982.1 hypothetical protein [Bacilli bacterium]MDD4718503.1 hypothetical protein [Bacilli bacterium]